MNFMQHWKEGAILGLCAFILLMRFGPLQPEPEVLERVQVEYRDRVQVVYKDRVVYKERVITKPDGTRIEERTESREQTKEKEKERDRKKDEQVVVKHPLPRYTVGVTYNLLDKEYQAQVGLRLANTPFFLQAFISGPRGGLGLGLTLEMP
jgi:hypothetical protein